MFRTMLSRRRREDARTDAFLHAIRLSDRYTVDPAWELQTVPDGAPQPGTGWRTDTVAFPSIILAGTIL